MLNTRLAVLGLLIGGLVAAPTSATAQIGGIKKKIERKIDRAADREVDQALDKTENEIRCTAGDSECIAKAKKDGKTVVVVNQDGDGLEGMDATQPGTGVWRNYDFFPGSKVWYMLDLDNARVGRIPAEQIEFVKGNVQVVELDGEKVLEFSAASEFRLNLPEQLPEDFTVEFYVQIPASNMQTKVFFSPLETSLSRYESHYLSVFSRPGIYKAGQPVSQVYNQDFIRTWLPVKFQADGSYAIMYVGTERVAQVPNITIDSSNEIIFTVSANSRFRAYIKDIVIAVGVDKLYDKLMETGEFVTRGILFDFDKDRLRGESTPVLLDIQETLEQHPDLRIVIEGHTDSQGAEEYNQELSERRAKAVVEYLIDKGIDGDRMEWVGKGEAEPAVSNDTTEGREQNRRVVIRTMAE